ncbi:hypothetical protein CI109_100283 [Kwoniella shandongensis]|uniref:Uncharacterized protein n=1 Tax=Kwoniella shandongensis TaxID=1734106 RepID=A0A5M6C818_9TREE|nr:uncharacterized protein CI109_001872 [Kwoniella shandongensis]KAA5529932.1 hypothetical protein CI109_001872 [Kwoniella shandongensis]
MARRRVPIPYNPSTRAPPSALQTRWGLLTYAFSRLPPRQLPFLAGYAYLIIYAADRSWIPSEALGKGGASVLGVLSMVTGLLLSYRFSSAIAKWDEGKQVWVGVRTTIRDGMRMLSVPTTLNSQSAVSPASTTIDLGEGEQDGSITPDEKATSVNTSVRGKKDEQRDPIVERVDELSGLLVGFAFALQHHLHGSRPLPQPPLCDLLPPAYLSSLKRTEARVRFAESHAGPSGSRSLSSIDLPNGTSTMSSSEADTLRPGMRRRSTGPPTKEERDSASAGEDEWDLSNLRDRAEEAVTKLAEAVALTAGAGGLDEGASNQELRQQLNQLNLPDKQTMSLTRDGIVVNTMSATSAGSTTTTSGSGKPKSNLYLPYPPNLPLALLKLMEAYVIGLAEVAVEKGGWTEAKRERGLGMVKSLSGHLGEAERLSSNPPPLPLTLHLSHLLHLYLAALPCSLLCVVKGWPLILITLIAGWGLLGLEALIGEVGGVFGSSENHHPLPRFTQQILGESLDVSPSFMRYYRGRVISRAGEGADEVEELDRRRRRGMEEWLPTFS